MDYSLINLRLQSDRANHQVLYFNHASVNKPCHHNATYLPSYVYTYTNVTRPMFFPVTAFPASACNTKNERFFLQTHIHVDFIEVW